MASNDDGPQEEHWTAFDALPPYAREVLRNTVLDWNATQFLKLYQHLSRKEGYKPEHFIQAVQNIEERRLWGNT